MSNTKLQITITTKEHDLLQKKATRLGFDVTKYAKFLLTREAFDQFEEAEECKPMTAKIEKIVNKALADFKAGKAEQVESLSLSKV